MAQAGVGALGAVGQYQSGQAQAAAANANAENTYRHQLVMYHGKNAALRNQYKQRQVQYQEQVRENNLALSVPTLMSREELMKLCVLLLSLSKICWLIYFRSKVLMTLLEGQEDQLTD